MAVAIAWLYTAVVLVSIFCYHTLSQHLDNSTSALLSSPTLVTGQTIVQNHSIQPVSSSLLHLHVGAMFCDTFDYFESCVQEFNRSLALRNGSEIQGDMVLSPVALLPLNSAHLSILYTCDAVQHKNISVFVAVGRKDMINFLSIVTEDTGIPLLGYTTDLDSLSFKVKYFSMYVLINPGCHHCVAFDSHKWQC